MVAESGSNEVEVVRSEVYGDVYKRQGVQRAGIRKGDKVLVVGSGTIGVLAATAAKALGGEVYICDVQAPKLAFVQEQFGFAGTILNDSPGHFTEAISKITGTYEEGGNVPVSYTHLMGKRIPDRRR